MSRPLRRVPPPNASQAYSAVPQSPRSGAIRKTQPQPLVDHSRPTARGPSGGRNQLQKPLPKPGRGAITQGVATGTIGGGYGPYSYNPNQTGGNGVYNPGRFSGGSGAPSDASHTTAGEKPLPMANTQTVPAYMWDTKDPDLDDPLHNPDPIRDAALDRSFTLFSARGWLNASALLLLMVGLITLFAGYPVIAWYRRTKLDVPGFNIGGINGTGQIPELKLPSLIDDETPSAAYSRTGTDGKTYNLVFSDEFNTDGRTFYPGDDPFWEAADLQYWPTGDLEWYDPSAITTSNGKLVITLFQKNNHDLNFMSGMLTSWNKLCFTTGYIEMSVSMPGSPRASGLWPAAWTMGNLGRAGYGATTEGMWPYSYDTCDLGTFPNQTAKDGTPASAATGSSDGGPLSFLPGQRLSACTCPGSDHPGPSTSKGRGAPEIDIFETQVNTDLMRGEVSQSLQTAPYNYQYNFVNTTPDATIYDPKLTKFNVYKGGVFQQAISAVSSIGSQFYNDQTYAPYGFEWWSDPKSRDEGYVTWLNHDVKTWTMTARAIGPDSISQVSQRLVPEEPMYIIMNLGLSPSFQRQDFAHLQFPSRMYVDYVRVYQRDGIKNGVTCNPPSHPTTDYINKHLNAYTNPNLTTWEQADNTFPRNSLYDGC